MDLKDILAISGHPGLFKFISQGRSAIIVENLESKKRISAFASEKISSLEDISVFKDDKDVSLVDIFKAIYDKENGGPAIDHKSRPEDMKEYFAGIIPDYDRDRVYVSDMKKIFLWYNLLLKLGMVTFEEEKEAEKEEDEKDKAEAKEVETKKKTPPKAGKSVKKN
ncbi:MAG: DUF5606 domain-containing protein [Bacteroidales bacterium]|nr:MAG: DUF5606 domain-containing protein [Bacteroidales bacterium]